jgi:hypothetical protein
LGCIAAYSETKEPCSSKIIELPEHLYLVMEQINISENKIYVNIYDEIY